MTTSIREREAEAMKLLADNPSVIFVGQNVVHPGAATYSALANVGLAQRLEFPVAEDTQMGFCIGLALMGYIPVAVYPRMDFLILAMNQIVNHLDKLEECSQGVWRPGVIVRTHVGAPHPLDGGPQHSQDHTAALQAMLRHVRVVKVTQETELSSVYAEALAEAEDGSSTVVVEALHQSDGRHIRRARW